MTFNQIIINPPYNGNLHIKIMNNMVSFLNPNGKIVNLSPIRWMQDPTAEYKNNSDWTKFSDLKNRISNLETINAKEANGLFNIGLLQPLGLYEITADLKSKYNHTEFYQKVFKKIIDNNLFNKTTISNYSDNLLNYVCLNTMAPPMKYGNPMFHALKQFGYFSGKGNDKYSIAKENCSTATRGKLENTICVLFDTLEQTKNCFNSFNTTFCKFICMVSVTDIHIHQEFLPWMNSCVNPRTNTIGYETEWTDNDFYTFFNITKKEQKIIENSIKTEKSL